MSARHLLASAVSLYSQYPWDDNIAMKLSVVTSSAESKRKEYFWWERSEADATDDLIRPLDQHNILSQEATSWTKEKCYNSDWLNVWVSAEIKMCDIHLPSLFPSKKRNPRAKLIPATLEKQKSYGPQKDLCIIWPPDYRLLDYPSWYLFVCHIPYGMYDKC